MKDHYLLTGSAGKIGRVASEHLMRSGIPHVPRDLPDANLFDVVAWDNPMIHLAVDWSSPERTLAMTQFLLPLCRKRFIFASSITVDPASGFLRHNYLTAAKLACESWARAWAHETGGTAVALRFGHFGSEIGSRSALEEAVRVSPSGIAFWLDRALSDNNRPGDLTILNAIGDATAGARP